MDLIRDILERIAARLPETLTRELARELEREIRAHWGSDRVYIAKRGAGARARNAAILRDWRNGERVALIARRYRLSRMHVWRIISNARLL